MRGKVIRPTQLQVRRKKREVGRVRVVGSSGGAVETMRATSFGVRDEDRRVIVLLIEEEIVVVVVVGKGS